MEIKNKKVRKGFLIAGVTLGIVGWSILGYGYYANEYKPNAVTETDDVGEGVNKVVKIKSNPNLEKSVESFLNTWVEIKGEEVNTLITENFDSVTGYYAYPVNITEVGKVISMNLGLSVIEVPKQNVTTYDGFLDSVGDLQGGDNGLAIVKYNNNGIDSVEIRQLDSEFEEIQSAVLKAKVVSNKKEVDKTKEEEKTYASLTAEEWKGMALLTSREVFANNMAPIFIVPTTSLTISKDLTDTFYYIIAGTLMSSKDGNTVLKTYEGKKVNLDFEVEVDDKLLGNPVWIHIVTKDGAIQNNEVQFFEGADVKTMAEGLVAYINVASVTEKN